MHHYSPFYMHGTGHWLGLDVHDRGSYKVDGKSRPLEPGMAFTVEPGLYVAVDKGEIVAALAELVPQFRHAQTGLSLDDRC